MDANNASLTPELRQRFNQAIHLIVAGRCGEAETCIRDILAQRPGNTGAHHNLGMALKAQGKPLEAMAEFRAAIALRPDLADPWNSMGDTLRELNRAEEAIKAFRHALALRPAFAEAHNNLGIALSQCNRQEEAVATFRQALASRGQFAEAWKNLALALTELGQLDEALSCLDKTVALQPNHGEAHETRLCTLHYHPAFDAGAIYRAARQWNDHFAAQAAGTIAPHANDRSPGRRLRIGYVSPDFRVHCSMLFVAPLLAHHDRGQFQVFCYSNSTTNDAVTQRWRSAVDGWREIAGRSDTDVAQWVRLDNIDILVDLALHVKGGRLGIFARKPAPVQVTWLGYPGTTGLDTVDYRLTDPRLDQLGSEAQPPTSATANDLPSATASDRRESAVALKGGSFATKEDYYSERSVRLPDCFWCYDPRGMDEDPGAVLPAPGPLPALSNGYLTFGCLNNFCKVTQPTLALWRGVLAALPSARLILLTPPGEHRRGIVENLGVNPDRVEFVVRQPRRQYLETYRRIDVGLDTIPYNGHTTTLDALWMGVPVVTRVGQTVVGRAGWSHLHNLNLLDLVAQSDPDFVQVAASLAGNMEKLAGLRETLRPRMEQSPLMDGVRFTRNVEAAYRRMWQAWCGEEGR